MKKLLDTRWKRSKGLVAILTVLTLPLLLAVIGLAVDTGRTFLVKAKLFSAVDAASIAAARAVANGEDAGGEVANRYFSANMPTDFHNSTATLNSVNYGYDEFGNISIDIDATVEVQNLFLGILGFDSFESHVEAQSVRRPVDLVLVIDNTTSLRYGSIGDVTQDVVDRSKSFVENFHESFDRISLVKFAFGAQVPVEFTELRGHSRSAITTAIDAFNFGSYWNAQYTNASEGMYRALDEMRNVSNPANLKVIVFFTDGAPNTFASHFEFSDGNTYAGAIRTNDESSGTPYGLWRHDSMATRLSGDGYSGSSIYSDLEELPDHYNPHDEDEAEFKVLNPSHAVRPVTQYTTNSTSQLFTKVNRVARNLVEDMAEAARLEGTYVFTLGLGSSLISTSGPDGEYGEDLLLRMANDPAMLDDADLAGDYKSSQLEGVYCHAVDEEALGPCFDQMLDVIIRLTM